METDQPGKTSPLAKYLRLLNSIHDVNKLSFSKRPLEDQLNFLFHSEKVRDYRPKMYSETKNVFRAYECSSKAKNCDKISTKFARLKDALRFAPRFGDMFADIVMFRASLTSKMLHRPDEALRQIAELGSGFGKQKSAEVRKLEQDLRETLKQGSFKTTDHNSNQYHWLDLTKEERISPFCSVSDKIKLGKTGKKGFGYFAEVDLKPGEVLISETALSSVLMPDTWATHCNMCHNQVYVGFPCPKCPHVIYCDKECYQRSQTFHKFECKAMVNLRELCLLHPTALVALKMVLSTNLRDLVGTKGRRLSRKPQDQDYLQKYHPGDWRSTFNLQQSQANEDSELVLSNAKLAVYLVKLLEEMGYFAAQDYPASTEEKICLSELLSHWLSTFASNCFPISTPQVKKAEDEVKVWLSATGTGIFPSSAMFNHACYPNATAYFLNNKLVIRTHRSIKQGEEVTISYGVFAYCDSEDERQMFLLDKYNFACSCEACSKHWAQVGCDSEILMLRPESHFVHQSLKKRKSLMSVCEQCGPYQAHSDRILQLADVDQMFKNATAWVLDTEQTVTNYKSPKCVKPHQCAFRAQNLLIKCFLVDAVLAKPVLIASRHEIPDIDQNHQVLPQQVKSRTQPKFLRIVDSLGTS